MVIETACQVTTHFDMLDLVRTDWHDVGIIGQDVCRHQYRVGEEACLGSQPLVLLFLVRMTTFQEAHRGTGHQQPGEFRNLWYIGLDKQDCPGRVQAQGE